jgi:D(-)-tartrate dehydratase
MRMLDVLEAHGGSSERCLPHGGHQFALHIAAGLGLGGNESYPGLFAPFGGFADTTRVKDGLAPLTDCPGIGFEEKSRVMDLFRRLF